MLDRACTQIQIAKWRFGTDLALDVSGSRRALPPNSTCHRSRTASTHLPTSAHRQRESSHRRHTVLTATNWLTYSLAPNLSTGNIERTGSHRDFWTLIHAVKATMAGPAGATSSRWYKPMPGFHPHQPAFKHRWGAKLLGATMWFWIFYRAKQDGAVLLVS